METLSGFNPEAEKNEKKRSLELLAGEFEVISPVRVTEDGLNGDLLGDVKKLVGLLATKGGITVLYGNYRSGKTSILRTLSDNSPDVVFFDLGTSNERTAEASFDLIRRKPDAKVIIADEIGYLPEDEQSQFIDRLLTEGKGLMITMHLGREAQGALTRSIARNHKVNHFTVNMVSRDTETGLARRLEHFFLRTKSQAIAIPGINTRHIFDTRFTEDAFAEIGKITAFRPWEVQAFFRGFFASQTGAKLGQLIPPQVCVRFTPSKI